ncbi:fungal hydrophobin [Trametes versicolor FP-101664 SS1]|uniref:fungal hydrophobin n=1 Tax=Trametes versicolor (strain FP-101664) TaxID=717944 RepID=UPI0004622F5A|nr:fungal hydrophobin [Trametes versicolor FP-101664 SS1]EIW57768.1 fungal hydrophobin [Trametes versicolor FP-101664 SS1]
MKFAYAVAALVATAASVQAGETNGQRLARGLSPMPPKRMYHPSRASEAKRATPSGTPPSGGSGNCNTGPVQCCNSVQKAGTGGVIGAILGLLDVVLDPEALVGLQCSPLSAVGVGGSSCSSTPVCCENNSQGGLISIGCIPIIL